MTNWIEAAKQTLLPLSEADDLTTALKEWQYTGKVIDHGDADATCELCHKEDLRWHFGIKNRLNNSEMLVGSRCILRFEEIDVLDVDTGKIARGDHRRLVLNRAQGRMISEAKRKVKEAERQVKEAAQAAERQVKEAAQAAHREMYLTRLRTLWTKATKSRPFIESIATRYKTTGTITQGQYQAIEKLLRQFKIGV